jgi:antitoxin (DNA-binding transcriptional repressor) of toxin-antitoxin stability system
MIKTDKMRLRLGMAEARLRLPELAASLAREPDRVIEITRRGRPVLHLVAPPRVESQARAARRILQRVARLEGPGRPGRKEVARRYKDLLYARD